MLNALHIRFFSAYNIIGQVIHVNFDISYWTKVLKRLLIFILTCLGIFLSFKLALFYIPFLIAFIISLLVEPLIRMLNRKTNMQRKTSAIVVLVIVAIILVLILSFGIIAIISESSNLLQGLNGYIEKIYNRAQEIINNIDFKKIKLPLRFCGNF